MAEAKAPEVRGLSVDYGPSHAVQGVDLTLPRGVKSVAGRSGMGKTTPCKRKLRDRVEGIVAASVKPLEKIEDIRIVQMDGLGHGGGGGGTATDAVINAALRRRVQAPLVDSLPSELGIDGAKLARQGGRIREASDMARIAKDAAPAKPATPKKVG